MVYEIGSKFELFKYWPTRANLRSLPLSTSLSLPMAWDTTNSFLLSWSGAVFSYITFFENSTAITSLMQDISYSVIWLTVCDTWVYHWEKYNFFRSYCLFWNEIMNLMESINQFYNKCKSVYIPLKPVYMTFYRPT